MGWSEVTGTQTAAWAFRAPLLGAFVAHLLGGFGSGARMATIGLVLTFVPRVFRALVGWRTPPIVELPYVLAVSLESTSKAFGLANKIRPWDKLVHFTELFLFSWIASVLFHGYRDRFAPRLSTRLAHGAAVLAGVAVGALWEVVEYTIDRFTKQNLVKSVRGTVLDLLVDTAGAIAGAILGGVAYRRTDRDERRAVERNADRLLGRVRQDP